jgi:hypothetical protein
MTAETGDQASGYLDVVKNTCRHPERKPWDPAHESFKAPRDGPLEIRASEGNGEPFRLIARRPSLLGQRHVPAERPRTGCRTPASRAQAKKE